MKLLVLGPTGRVGRQLILDYPQAMGANRDWVQLPKLTELASFLRNVNPDVVINCAAYTQVDEAEQKKNRELVLALNEGVPATLGAWASEAPGNKVIHLSTDFVFDGKKGEPYDEDDLPSPINMYGESKLAGECAMIKAEGGYVVRISHPFNNLFTGAEDILKKLVEAGYKQDAAGAAVKIVERLVTFTYIPSLSQYLLTMAEELHQGVEPVHRLYHCVCMEALMLPVFVGRLFARLNLTTEITSTAPTETKPKTQTARRPSHSALAVTRYPGESRAYRQPDLDLVIFGAVIGRRDRATNP